MFCAIASAETRRRVAALSAGSAAIAVLMIASGSPLRAAVDAPVAAPATPADAAVPSPPADAAAPATAADVAVPPAVIPNPALLTRRPGRFVIEPRTAVLASGGAEAVRIAGYFAGLMRTSHGVSLPVRRQAATAVSPRALAFRLDASARGTDPESYTVDVTPARAIVSARTPHGLFYGAVTLWQLASSPPAPGVPLGIPALRIEDAPRFPWRGLMLDSARHFQSPGFVMRY
ncbi:MAG: beta-N-acetylhexosaminidase, partial [Gammaproteobacteria bacterium]|nr:beta-N-acetylhexosaminidase [Gammaproteobacteria bacterium]